MSFVVGIDGPAGSGKGTITKIMAKQFGLTNITYRAVAKATLDKGVSLNETEKIIEIASNLNLEIKNEENIDKVYLDGIDITKDIRSKEVTAIVSQVSSIKEVRYKMVDLQRKLAEGKDIIMEGRDICTYVFPNADVKIYLDASIEERAKRRFKENQEKGIDMTYEEVYENIKLRDENDKNKEVGALKVAEDSIIVDTTGLTIDEVATKVANIIKNKYQIDNVK